MIASPSNLDLLTPLIRGGLCQSTVVSGFTGVKKVSRRRVSVSTRGGRKMLFVDPTRTFSIMDDVRMAARLVGARYS